MSIKKVVIARRVDGEAGMTWRWPYREPATAPMTSFPGIDPEVAVRRMPRPNARACLAPNKAVKVFVRGSYVYRVFGDQGTGTGASRALSYLGTPDFLHVNVAKPSGARARR